jgi:hypothetical protein
MVGLQPPGAKGRFQMGELLTATATRPPAFRDRTGTDHTDHKSAAAAERRRARLWTVIEALAYAGAYIDPSGVLAIQRLRQAHEEEQRHAQR